MNEGQEINIGEAKGRPMLHWVGKRPLDYVKAFPAQKVEVFNPLEEANAAQGLLFHGDNKEVLAWLLSNGYRGKVDLVYIDPPFDSGADYVRRVELRGVKSEKLQGEAHSLGEQIQYTDIWNYDFYYQFMYERILLLKELLSDQGSIYLHCDWRMNSFLRLILDEIFGNSNFRNEITWSKTTSAKSQSTYFSNVIDTILFYTKSENAIFNAQYIKSDNDDKNYPYLEEKTGRRYGSFDFTQSGSGPSRRFGDKTISPPSGKHWIWSQEKIDDGMKSGKIIFTSLGTPRVKRYLDEKEGNYLGDLWVDGEVKPISANSNERIGYPTQKPEALLHRIISSSSNVNDIVLDCFIGSGTTAAVAQRLGRRWIGADINKGAIQTTSKRLQSVINEQIAEQEELEQGTLAFEEGEEHFDPAALSFSVYRVNDYDLQIQHNEAAKIAIEHVGVQEIKTDIFFDGTRGDKLVKIIPFNHPLTQLDLQMIKDEIESREDQRDILVVALGKETQVDTWLEGYNDHRAINSIEVIELRTDEKYGEFLVHQPDEAEVTFLREGSQLVVEIVDFISPTIVKRLDMDTPLFKVKIPDWRAMVDCVMIDTDYDGEIFNIVLSDVPERKNDLVQGRYEIPVPDSGSVVAVKIIDMLGEELVVTKKI